ncbi:hypothetical protein COP2_012693 [Malus domestica]
MKAAHYYIWNNMLVRRFFSGLHIRCLSPLYDLKIFNSIHEWVCGNHSGGHSLAQKVLNTSYYWLTMHQNAKEYVQKVRKLPALQAPPPADEFIAIHAVSD